MKIGTGASGNKDRRNTICVIQLLDTVNKRYDRLGIISDEVRPIILKVISNQKYREIVRKNEAGAFSEEDLEAQAMYEEVINLDEVVTAFVQSGAEARWKGEPVSDLFSFLLQYHFHREVDEKERTTFFCQIVSLYESQLEIRNEFGLHNQYEYAKIYPL